MKILLFLLLITTFYSNINFSHAEDNSSYYAYEERCLEYKEFVLNELRDNELPEYFYFLLLAESGCKPDVVSKMGAVGLFQVMPSTFRHYSQGICENCSLEDMKNPYNNIIVAVRYIKSLYKRFNGDLDFTVAGYNAGGSNIIRKINYSKGMRVGVIKDIYPEAYNLAIKVRKFYNLSKLD